MDVCNINLGDMVRIKNGPRAGWVFKVTGIHKIVYGRGWEVLGEGNIREHCDDLESVVKDQDDFKRLCFISPNEALVLIGNAAKVSIPMSKGVMLKKIDYIKGLLDILADTIKE